MGIINPFFINLKKLNRRNLKNIAYLYKFLQRILNEQKRDPYYFISLEFISRYWKFKEKMKEKLKEYHFVNMKSIKKSSIGILGRRELEETYESIYTFLTYLRNIMLLLSGPLQPADKIENWIDNALWIGHQSGLSYHIIRDKKIMKIFKLTKNDLKVLIKEEYFMKEYGNLIIGIKKIPQLKEILKNEIDKDAAIENKERFKKHCEKFFSEYEKFINGILQNISVKSIKSCKGYVLVKINIKSLREVMNDIQNYEDFNIDFPYKGIYHHPWGYPIIKKSSKINLEDLYKAYRILKDELENIVIRAGKILKYLNDNENLLKELEKNIEQTKALEDAMDILEAYNNLYTLLSLIYYTIGMIFFGVLDNESKKDILDGVNEIVNESLSEKRERVFVIKRDILTSREERKIETIQFRAFEDIIKIAEEFKEFLNNISKLA